MIIINSSLNGFEDVTTITSFTDEEDLIKQVVSYIRTTKIGDNEFTRATLGRGKDINFCISSIGGNFISGTVYSDSNTEYHTIWGILNNSQGGTWRFTSSGGADTVTPFKSGGGVFYIGYATNQIDVSNILPNQYRELKSSNFYFAPESIGWQLVTTHNGTFGMNYRFGVDSVDYNSNTGILTFNVVAQGSFSDSSGSKTLACNIFYKE